MLAGVNRERPANTRNGVHPGRAPGRRERYRECPSEGPPAADGEMLAGPAPGSDGGVPQITGTAMTTSSVENRNPPSTSDDRNPSVASVSSAGPAAARTHAATWRVRDRCLNHVPRRPPSTLTSWS